MNFPPSTNLPASGARSGLQGGSGRGVTAILGPTNTGKTHLAIERMAAHSSGLIGLPLRLLAREVYQRLCEKVGVASVALITGEEKIVPPRARYQVCTVEAMPSQADVAFVAIDEVQLAADFERGHIFTDRLLNLRGREETLLLGAETMAGVLRHLLPGIEIVSRPRMSVLTYAGSKKITRLQTRSAIVAFSAGEVYAIAELVRRQRGGAAVVMGSLSPRTRNAQVELYQAGDADFLVATDAIGMGLNLDVRHVAFAQDRKFDGRQYRRLTAGELGQIAGRAGRHMRDGTFGVTGQVPPLEGELAGQLESHAFEPVKVLNWRNRDLDFSSIGTLRQSLEMPSGNRLLMKALPVSDLVALETLSRERWVHGACTSAEVVRLLWDVCCVPDYRKISPASHGELLLRIFRQISERGKIDTDWFSAQIKQANRRDGGIDALSARIAQIRTWTYLSHREEWLDDAPYWQETARQVEDSLSYALHEALTKRFIDRRTSQLMRKLRDNASMEAEIKPDGAVQVEGHHVGKLAGFRFTPDTAGQSPEAKAANAAASKALTGEMEKRANRLNASPNTDFALDSDGMLRWQGEPVGKLVAGEDYLHPRIVLLADEQLTGTARDQVVQRLDRWIANHTANVLKPLVEMSSDQTLEGLARGTAFRLVENYGNIQRREIASDVQNLSQDMRAGLRRHGVRFGAYTIYVPALLKPAPAELLCLLWAVKNDRLDAPGRAEVLQVLASGRTSAVHEASYEDEVYRICGYRILGAKAVRIDILERLADLIRPALYYKAQDGAAKPEGAIDGRSFYVTPAMLSILGATHEDMELVLKGLGYRGEPKLESDVKPPEPVAEQGAADAAAADGAAPETENAVAGEAGDVATPQVASEGAGPSSETVTLSGEPQAEAAANNGSEAASPALVERTETDAEAKDQPEEGVAADAAADGASDGGQPDASGEADEGPKTILVWRPAPRKTGGKPRRATGQDQGKRQDGGENRGPRKGKGKHAKPGGKGRKPAGGQRMQSGPKKNRDAIDPDSPFAKLAALKEDLKKGE
ncbi:helicase-related protein [Salaquimonas pukyongi]|uniref:helicase-related protein n=1 Tax=Salaquimonas pukyongi TaxID=2712698 RepID=UPI00096BB970|nr:helicase-related protein [Salaquimonas pukyongi]